MKTYKIHEKYKGFSIYKKDCIYEKDFFGFKMGSDKKYEFRTKNYKTLKSVKTSIDKYIVNNQIS